MKIAIYKQKQLHQVVSDMSEGPFIISSYQGTE